MDPLVVFIVLGSPVIIVGAIILFTGVWRRVPDSAPVFFFPPAAGDMLYKEPCGCKVRFVKEAGFQSSLTYPCTTHAQIPIHSDERSRISDRAKEWRNEKLHNRSISKRTHGPHQ